MIVLLFNILLCWISVYLLQSYHKSSFEFDREEGKRRREEGEEKRGPGGGNYSTTGSTELAVLFSFCACDGAKHKNRALFAETIEIEDVS